MGGLGRVAIKHIAKKMKQNHVLIELTELYYQLYSFILYKTSRKFRSDIDFIKV